MNINVASYASYPVTSAPSTPARETQAAARPVAAESEAAAGKSQKAGESGETATTRAEERRQSQQQQVVIAELSKRDREVRAHEQAHASVGGIHAGAASLSYERGPNGKLYAVAGEVPINLSVVADNPRATLENALIVQRAALAPVNPSSADRRIAAQAVAIAAEARSDLAAGTTNSEQSPRTEAIQTQDDETADDGKNSRPNSLDQDIKASGALASESALGNLFDFRI